MTKVSISPDRLREHIAALTAHGPRFADLPGVPAALRYVTDELTGMGLPVRVERYGHELHEVNLIAEILGGTSDDAIELCAHWDTVETTPGADDNASGVAGVLEAARALRDFDLPARTIRFCFFGGEEDGFQGSTAHVQQVTPATAAIIFEMIGFSTGAPHSQRIPDLLAGIVDIPDRGDFIALVANPDSADLADEVAAAADPQLRVFPLIAPTELMPAIARSDHMSYWNSGRRALLITDTADYRHPEYHQAGDTLDRLDLVFAAHVTAAAATAIATLTTQPG